MNKNSEKEPKVNANLIAELLRTCETLLYMLLNKIGPSYFKNGVTAFGVDEGEQMARKIFAEAEAVIAKAKGVITW